jgi:hypothetical protein
MTATPQEEAMRLEPPTAQATVSKVGQMGEDAARVS